ncbi:hypothetical protein TD95_000841 [Thielaviopsis punctulata]|uniref:CoA-binding domain-containing protein n=1 Tax=Thielaviopsis punctulata TaxID=72032 RepID=A0A0F4ZL72_9PEZI|nr:hypothetical protein TD95_000841 [Thielaviopsis punctulata]
MISATESAASAFFSSAAFAVVGASSNPAKFGHQVFTWYLARSLPVVPVNPVASSISALSASYATVPSLSALPDPTHTSVSIITPPAVTLNVLREAKEVGIRAVWLQPGTWDQAVVDYVTAPGAFESVVGGDGGRGHGGWCVLVDGDKALKTAGKL